MDFSCLSPTVKMAVELNKRLMSAIDDADYQEVKKLLEKGADVTYVDEKGNTPLILAAENSPAPAFLSYSDKEYYERSEWPDKWSNAYSIVEILLEYGADVNAKNNEGISALYNAKDQHDVDECIIELLQEHGAKE